MYIIRRFSHNCLPFGMKAPPTFRGTAACWAGVLAPLSEDDLAPLFANGFPGFLAASAVLVGLLLWGIKAYILTVESRM